MLRQKYVESCRMDFYIFGLRSTTSVKGMMTVAERRYIVLTSLYQVHTQPTVVLDVLGHKITTYSDSVIFVECYKSDSRSVYKIFRKYISSRSGDNHIFV